MKTRELTPAYPYKGIHLQGFIELKQRQGARPVQIRWDIGTFDNYAETSNAIAEHPNTEPIALLSVETMSVSRRQHKIFHSGFSGIGSRWGHITVHKDQVEPFLAKFKPLWYAILHEVGMQPSKGAK